MGKKRDAAIARRVNVGDRPHSQESKYRKWNRLLRIRIERLIRRFAERKGVQESERQERQFMQWLKEIE